MKIQKLSENMSNLDKVVQNADINSVTEMPPTMSRAYIDSQEADKATKDIIKPADKVIKEKPFLGATKQPEPKEPEEAKINLDESLFDDDSPLTDPYDGDYSLSEQIFDFLDHSDSFDTAEMTELVSDEFGLAPDEADRYVQDWITNSEAEWHDTADQEEEEDIPLDILRDYLDSLEVEEEAIEECNQTELTEDAHNKPDCYDDLLGYYHEVIYNGIPIIQETEEAVSGYDGDWCREDMDPQVDKAIDQLAKALADDAVYHYRGPAEVDWSDETDVEFDESLKKKNLKEDGRSQSLLRQFDDTDIDEEELDLWTQVYSSLINKPDEATWKTMHKKDTVILPKKMRYETINTDADGNIVVYGKTEKDLDGGIKVAKYYNLDYDVNPTREVWAKKHPEQRFSLTIKIPEEKVTDIDKYFEK